MRNYPPAYNTWCKIKQRCDNKNNHKYYRYGGRGITYCQKWKTYNGFWDDMGSGYVKGLSIDRIDNDGNYCKENCRWATAKQQANNTSKNRHININGKKIKLSYFSEMIGIPNTTLMARIDKLGWKIERAINQKDKYIHKITLKEREIIKKLHQTGTKQVEIANSYKISQSAVSRIINSKNKKYAK